MVNTRLKPEHLANCCTPNTEHTTCNCNIWFREVSFRMKDFNLVKIMSRDSKDKVWTLLDVDNVG